MSAKKITGSGHHLESSVKLAGREATLNLSADKVSIHKNGIEFRSDHPFGEWSEMTVSLKSPIDGRDLSCHGVVVACAGGKHSGFNVSVLFTGISPDHQKHLDQIAHTQFGTL